MTEKVLAAYKEKKKLIIITFSLSNRGQISGDCYNANITSANRDMYETIKQQNSMTSSLLLIFHLY